MRTTDNQEIKAPLTPEAVEAGTVQRSKRKVSDEFSSIRARGIDWVRPTDLLARGGSSIARAGINFQKELARTTRAGMSRGTKALSERVHKLPPLSAFGKSKMPHAHERGAVAIQ